MKFALLNNERIEPEPKLKAMCPLCKCEVISKCGSIKVWHWSHISNKDCDDWYEPESQWHIDWKNEFPKECQEFTMGRHRADIRTKNRWIIELQNSSISPSEIIDREEYYKKMVWLLNGGTLAKGLRIREKKNILSFRWKNPPKSWWECNKEIYIDLSQIVEKLESIIDGYIVGGKKHLTAVEEYKSGEYYDEYGQYQQWESDYPSVSHHEDTTKAEIERLRRKIELFNNNIFWIKKIHNNIPCGGWGDLISKETFINKFK